MQVALDRDFSSENPYSRFAVTRLRLGGHYKDTHWEFNSSTGYRVEVEDSSSKKDGYDFGLDMIEKGKDYKSDKIKIYAINEHLYHYVTL